MRLHGYQQAAKGFLQGDGRGLFLDLGLGKTATTLSALEPRHLPALVVAPKRVAEHVWPAERALWRPDLSLALAAGEPKARAAALARGADVTVISRDNLAGALGGKYRTLILDELSSFKGRGVRFKTARKLADKADVTWGLTGTPSPNGYLDLWAQVYLLDKGARLGRTFGGYRERYFRSHGMLPNGTPIDWRPKEGAEQRIRELISDICLYMSADGNLDLPPVTFNRITVPLAPAIRKMYNTFKEDLVLDLNMLGEFSASNAAVLTSKLAQISAGFLYPDLDDPSAEPGTWTNLHDSKLSALEEVVDGTGDNLLVFYTYVAEVERIKAKFPQARTVDEPGVIEAWCRGEVPMMLAHPASAGHGLNLQSGGHTIVWTSLTWDLELWLQANGRLARQGQQHPVIINVLEGANTVDHVIFDRLVGKTNHQAELLDHLRSPI